MIDLDGLESKMKKGLEGAYVFVGLDEMIISENIDKIVAKTVSGEFKDLNYIRIDGMKTSFDEIMNACETLPFFADKKVVVIYRANFIRDKSDAAGTKIYNQLVEYLKNAPSHCILVMYYLLNDKRENPTRNKKLTTLEKNATVVKVDKLKGERLYKKVGSIFEERGKNIGKVELRYFCDSVENNFNIIEREIDKLISYTEGRDITREDITKMLPHKSEDDVFDLVDFISQKKSEKSIDIMNELINKGENLMLILSLIQSQFTMLYKIKLGMEKGKTKDDLAKEIRRPAFICEKLMTQSRKFSYKQLYSCMKLCIETERKLKSTAFDKKTEMEIMIMSTLMV
ncbi:DNA polymerase III subunit delta [Clostridium manihotivorum]|uniref:DNA polymerase III subunit delta n=1 Tax=Clostridium manihotivorum TaxID=2320868 RepID=A0A3R5TEW5_9CLOT|nr:DNA polymerase III subunit delta [Clostridium manihotivorum]QAA31713.1 DNA polymerase III subunit delta [Clostridium manihotivorum]